MPKRWLKLAGFAIALMIPGVAIAQPTCTITCPANITTSTDPNQCGAVVTYPAPTTTGSCGTVTCSPPSGSVFPKGTTSVACSTTAGPSCSFNITVNDTQPPQITCPANIDQQLLPDETSRVINWATPTATDNCPGVGVVCNPPSGSSFPLGSTTVTCTATDTTNNTASCSFRVRLSAPVPVPAVSLWGLLGLGALLAATGFVLLRNRLF